MKKILSHFSEHEWVFDPNHSYVLSPDAASSFAKTMKPHGLWLSDESDYGWEKWCKEAEFRELNFRKDFEVDLSGICVLDTDAKIIKFHKEYAAPIGPEFTPLSVVQWGRLYDQYKGILISPYAWRLRLAPGFMWYYGWDCASACIWDLSAVKPVMDGL